MRALFVAVLFAIGTAVAATETSPSALEVLKLLPKEDLNNLAQIEGPEGAPDPDRWHILVYSRSSDTRLKEYVIAKGEIVATRRISQFAESLSPENIIDPLKIQTDSDSLAKLAVEYAKANDIDYAKIRYHLAKDGADAQPVWRVSCIDEKGKALGTIIATAGKGTIVSHDGFAVEPSEKLEKTDTPRKAKSRTETRAIATTDPNPKPTVVRPGPQIRPEPIAESPQRGRNRDRRQRNDAFVDRSRRAPIQNPGAANRDPGNAIRRTLSRLFSF